MLLMESPETLFTDQRHPELGIVKNEDISRRGLVVVVQVPQRAVPGLMGMRYCFAVRRENQRREQPNKTKAPCTRMSAPNAPQKSKVPLESFSSYLSRQRLAAAKRRRAPPPAGTAAASKCAAAIMWASRPESKDQFRI